MGRHCSFLQFVDVPGFPWKWDIFLLHRDLHLINAQLAGNVQAYCRWTYFVFSA